MKKLTSIFFMLLVLNSFSQEPTQYKNLSKNIEDYDFHSQLDLGAGIGLNYGGLLGFQAGYIPINHLSVFGSVGYYLVGFGWQIGASGYIMPKIPSKPFRVYGTVMYGTNVAIAIIDNSSYDKIYLGPTIGGGIEMRFGKSKKNGLNVDLFYPIRSAEYESDWNNIKNNPNFTDTQDPLPVTISVGYHLEIK